MAEHTKGPWKWSTKCDTENRSLTGNEEYIDQHGEHIPIAYLHESYRSEETKSANARLIAAAPGMLKTCEDALEFFVQFDLEQGVISGLSIQLRDNLAEAKGAE